MAGHAISRILQHAAPDQKHSIESSTKLRSVVCCPCCGGALSPPPILPWQRCKLFDPPSLLLCLVLCPIAAVVCGSPWCGCKPFVSPLFYSLLCPTTSWSRSRLREKVLRLSRLRESTDEVMESGTPEEVVAHESELRRLERTLDRNKGWGGACFNGGGG